MAAGIFATRLTSSSARRCEALVKRSAVVQAFRPAAADSVNRGERVPGIALAIYVAFFAIGLGWRAWLQYRRTGDHGLRALSGRTGSVGCPTQHPLPSQRS